MKRNTKIIGALALVGGLIVAGGCSIGGGDSSSPDKFYTVTFVQDGYADIIRTVKEGASLTDIPSTQAKVGYTVEWQDTDFSNITQDLTIQAIAVANEYLITYQISETDGETMEGEHTQTVTYDATYELATPAKANYNFLGWKADEQILTQTGTWNIANDVTLVPTWKVASYAIVFEQTDGTEIVRLVDYGSTLSAEEIPEPLPVDGYEVAWSVTDFSTISGNTNVTVVKTPKQYTVSYQLENGESLEADTFEYNSPYALKTPTKAGYSFRYWKDAEGTPIPATGTWNYLKNLELTAEWTANNNIITFVYKDGTTAERTLETGATLTDIPTLTPVEGYDVYWSITDFSTITGATTVTEERKGKTYEVTFIVPEDSELNGTKVSVTYGSAYTFDAPKSNDFAFASWEYNGASIPSTGDWSIANSVELEATWYCTVTFVYQDETTVVRTVKKGTGIAASDIPACSEKVGYTSAWDVADFSKIDGNMTVVEKVTANEYKITFELDGGTGATEMTVTYGKSYTIANPKKDGYKFDGWVDENGNKFVATDKWTATSGIKLRATWSKVATEDSWTNNY